jgi:hypothetical protein
MRFPLATCVLIVAALPSLASAVDPAVKVAQSIVESGHKRVAVIPAVISRRGDIESTSGELGPRGRLMAHELYNQLVSCSQKGDFKGKFQVIPERTVRRAIQSRGFSLEDLGDPVKARDFFKFVGADSGVTAGCDESGDLGKLTAIDNTMASKDVINTEVVDAFDNATTYSQDFIEDRTLAKAAYSGESWEIRRWNDGKLENLGIDLDDKKAFGKGNKWEVWQYERLNEGLAHPYEIPDFPYEMAIVVDGEVREPQPFQGVHGTQYVVELNPGEKYSLRMKNESDEPVFAAIFIDGVNTIDKVRAEPEDLETRRHWFLKPDGKESLISGWYVIDRDENRIPKDEQYYNEFKIVPREETVAFGLGLDDDRIGIITVVYYTVGMDGIDQPDDEELKSRGLPTAQFGTGMGDRKDQSLEFPKAGQKPRGIILATESYYYRTKEELVELNNGTAGEEDLAFLPKDDEDTEEKE